MAWMKKGYAEMVWDEEGIAEMVWDEAQRKKGRGIGGGGGRALLYSALERDCKQARGPRHEVRHVTNSLIFATHWKDILFGMHFQRRGTFTGYSVKELHICQCFDI